MCFHNEHPDVDCGKLLPAHLLKGVLMAHEEREMDNMHAKAKILTCKADMFRLSRKNVVEKYVAEPPPDTSPKPKAKASKVRNERDLQGALCFSFGRLGLFY